MLPREFKPKDYDSWDREPWPAYIDRLALPEHEPTRQFFRQVAYDHLDHFNEHFPDFELERYAIGMERMSAQDANDLIRYLGNRPMDWWADQYVEFSKRNQPYIIYQEMSKNLTPPFPPVLIDSSHLKDKDWRIYGRPYHLVEGTHRIGYMRHMLASGIIPADSQHDFVVLRPLAPDVSPPTL